MTPPYRDAPQAAGPGKTAVLLVNLGTPDAATAPALRRYLAEFLSDQRVVEIPRLLWLLILQAYGPGPYNLLLLPVPMLIMQQMHGLWLACIDSTTTLMESLAVYRLLGYCPRFPFRLSINTGTVEMRQIIYHQ